MALMDDVFKDYQGRRNGIIVALSSGLDELLKESKNVLMGTPFLRRKCLWGLPDGKWELKPAQYPAAGQIPPPQPLIPFDKQWDEWVSRMADLSDAWLVSLVYHTSSHLSLEERKSLVEKIGSMPSLKAVITPDCPLELLDINQNFQPEYVSRKSAPSFCMRRKCTFAGDGTGFDQWIQCNICRLWYHCQCCHLEQGKAEMIQFYKCAICVAKGDLT